MSHAKMILGMYEAMRTALGDSHWWPGETPFEISIGAILTQNTNWTNVEKAIDTLKEAGVMSPEAIHSLPIERFAELIRPAGYFNIKARRIFNFLDFMREEAAYSFETLKSFSLDDLRPKILNIHGIGPETADAILLYALGFPTFVIDAYTARMVLRHGLGFEGIDYYELQSLFMDVLPQDVAVYNEYHALIVRVGKKWCKKKQGDCGTCPLQPFLE
ncbi:endonuclease III domain-containing protein [Pseudodesulfovibrio sp. JC047]|uniref:endonuclease III domain-containing protein n=1 Tax=Pseudodesulfovibrio sp. JC047 TaxID=2683199 RepID=UPI0013CF5372|nr:endonuclease III domain-containing protein [Pseudodesulfovibrio sp. JC047]NDV19161.1 endonuclease III domain-containing protein [Pseudodesulfovibrio sp. JC047]